MRSFLAMLVLAAAAVAAPPVVSSVDLKAPVGKPTPLTVTVEKGKKLGTDKTYDATALMLARLWTDDASVYDFWVFPNADGVYYVPFWTEGETKGTVVKVTAGKGGTPTDPVKPPPTDPVKPPPVTGDRLHFMVVRPFNLTEDVNQAMKLPGWLDVKKAGPGDGHTFADWPVTSLSADMQKWVADKGVALPAVIVWKHSGNQIIHDKGRDPVPMPRTDDDIRKLVK